MYRSFAKFLVAMACLFGVTAASSPKTDGKVYLTKSNVLTLRGTVDEHSIGNLVRQIQMRPDQDLFLYIVSPGGDIMEGLHLIEAMKAHKGKITCVADVAISMAFVILQACETRLTLASAILMQHEASYGVRGTAPQNYSFVLWLQSVLKRMDETQANRIGMSYADFKAKTATDWWLDGFQAVGQKVADGFASVSCSKELTDSTIVEEIPLMFGAKAVLEWSGCPLIHVPNKISLKLPNDMKRTKEIEERYLEIIDRYTLSTDPNDNIKKLERYFNKIR